MPLRASGSASRTLPRLALLLLAAVFPAAWPSSAAFQDDFDRTLPMRAGAAFDLQNINGGITVQGWDRDEIQIQALKSSRGNPSDAERVSIDVTSTPRGVSVSTRYPQDEGVEVVVDYTVRLPHSARIQRIATINGTLRISGVDTLLDLRTVNGNIEVYDAGGAVHARTTNGGVRLDLPRFGLAAEATAETTNGSVLLAVPQEIQATLQALSLNGDFQSEIPLKLNGSLRPREIRGQFGKGGSPIRLRTVNGTIRVAALRPVV
jgi:DUF4097 and DUF4098 domain-containing protein YvlB